MDIRAPRTFQIKGNTYPVKFPTTGQFIDAERLKAQLSRGEYFEMMRSATVSAAQALDQIDTLAYITTLIPDLAKDSKVESLLDLDVIEMNELVSAYKKQIQPWIAEIITIIKKSNESDVEEAKKEAKHEDSNNTNDLDK